MKIGYKAVYSLLERFYAQRTLSAFITQDIDMDIFNASILFAKGIQDYNYLSAVVEKREALSDRYVFFTNYKAQHPIVLERDKDLTLLELVLLHHRSVIHIEEFKTMIEAIAGNAGLNEHEIVSKFETAVIQFKPKKINKES